MSKNTPSEAEYNQACFGLEYERILKETVEAVIRKLLNDGHCPWIIIPGSVNLTIAKMHEVIHDMVADEVQDCQIIKESWEAEEHQDFIKANRTRP